MLECISVLPFKATGFDMAALGGGWPNPSLLRSSGFFKSRFQNVLELFSHGWHWLIK